MKIRYIFIIILILGIFLIERYAYLQGSLLALFGVFCIMVSVLGLWCIWTVKIFNSDRVDKKYKKVCSAAFLLLLLTVLGLLHFFYFDFQKRQLKEFGKEMPIVVEDVVNESRRGWRADYMYYSFKVDGEVYRFSYEIDKEEIKKGQELMIKYLPSKPGNHEILGMVKGKGNKLKLSPIIRTQN